MAKDRARDDRRSVGSHEKMTAALGLAAQTPQLYHGTNATLKPGDMIKPGGFLSQGHVFSTTAPETAASYAQDAMAGGKYHPNNPTASQQSLWGMVYKVKPKEGDSSFGLAGNGVKGAHVSELGFQVEGPSHLIDAHGNTTSLTNHPVPAYTEYIGAQPPAGYKPKVETPSVSKPFTPKRSKSGSTGI